MLEKEDIQIIDEVIKEIKDKVSHPDNIFKFNKPQPIADEDLETWKALQKEETVDWYAENKFWRNLQEYLISLISWSTRKDRDENDLEAKENKEKYKNYQKQIRSIINKQNGMDRIEEKIELGVDDQGRTIETTTKTENCSNEFTTKDANNIDRNVNITITKRVIVKSKKDNKKVAKKISEQTYFKTTTEANNNEGNEKTVRTPKKKRVSNRKLSIVEVKIRNPQNNKLKKVKKLKGHVIIVNEEFSQVAYWSLEDLHLKLDKKGNVEFDKETIRVNKPESLAIDPTTGRVDIKDKEKIKEMKKERKANLREKIKEEKKKQKEEKKVI